MPDEIIEEEIQEQEPDESSSAFDEFAGDDSLENKEPEKELEKTKEKEEPAKEPEKDSDVDKDPKESEKTDDKKEESEKKELTAAETLAARAKEISPEDLEKKDPDAAKPREPSSLPEEKQKDPPPPSASSKRLTKEQIANFSNLISDDEFPEGEIIINDDVYDFEQIKSEDPELFNAMKVIGGIATAKLLNSALQSGQIISAKSVEDLKSSYDEQIGYLWWKDEVRTAHPDAFTVVETDDFKKWLNKQSATVKSMVDESTAEDAIKVIDAFKESVAKSKTDDHDDKLKKKKQITDNIHSHSLRSRPASHKSISGEKDDDRAAFNEFAAKDD